MSANRASLRFALVRSAWSGPPGQVRLVRSALVRIASVRSASLRSALNRFAPGC
jgi:hypothetical protein